MNEKIPQTLKRQFNLPRAEVFDMAVRAFSPLEKVLFWLCVGVFVLSAISLASMANRLSMVEVPARGGSFTEGIVGAPHLINPLFATSEADRDISSIVYAGLMKLGPDGNLVPELAKGYTIEDAGKIYTFTLKDDLTFHDGESLTADDVEFTIRKALDPATKSLKRANWEGVSVEVVNPQQIRFTLKRAYAPFLESTVLGILPKHIWKTIDPEQFAFSQFNVEPIGAGPYVIKEVTRDATGVPTSYLFNPFPEYALDGVFISDLLFRFYPSEGALLEAYSIGEVESVNTVSAQKTTYVSGSESVIQHTTLPRIFGVFFNQNQATVFTQKEVRDALANVTDRQEIIDTVLGGYGTAIYGPVPASFLGRSEPTQDTTTMESRITSAQAALKKAGWKPGKDGTLEKKVGKTTHKLTFSIATSNAEELARAATIIKSQWEKIGAKVTINTYEQGDFNQTILRPRKYDAVLFGEVIGRDLDLYAFWHSSQRNDPGANIALYTNSKADKILEDARATTDQTAQFDKIAKFEDEVNKDKPAIFLYSPEFIYLLPKTIQNFKMQRITDPSERFSNIESWYIKSELVWNLPFFTKNKIIINKQ